MSKGAVFVLIVVAMFPALIIVALVRRITIGEKTSSFEVKAILARYPVGTAVTVYYDPAHPQTAVLERDLPKGMMLAGGGCVLLFFIGGPLLVAAVYFNGLDWLRSHLANPDRAPFVAAAGVFGLLVLLFAAAFTRLVRQAARWPVTPGRIVATGVERYRDWRDHEPGYRQRRLFKPSVLYTYEVNGRQYTGDRMTIGLVISATFPGIARRLAARYPAGSEVEVYYNPQCPGESVLNPHTRWHYLLWLVAAAMFVLAWAVAAGWL